MDRFYSGVGSRSTPDEILQRMRDWAAWLARQGWTLRSGGADGADAAFEQGATQAAGACDIYLPWKGFNGHSSSRTRVCEQALALAESVHPAWSRLSDAARKLHARNCYQVLGKTLDRPSAFVLCWTPDGCERRAERCSSTGGTATAIVLAERHGVPVYNLARDDAEQRLARLLESLGLAAPAFMGNTSAPGASLQRQQELF